MDTSTDKSLEEFPLTKKWTRNISNDNDSDTDEYILKKKNNAQPEETTTNSQASTQDLPHTTDHLELQLPIVRPDNILASQPGSPPVICVSEEKDTCYTSKTIQLVESSIDLEFSASNHESQP